MRTGLTKKQKTTVIYFDEHSRIILDFQDSKK